MDAIKLYLRAIKDIPLLTAEQEKSLARKKRYVFNGSEV